MDQENHLLDVVIKKDFFVKSRKDNIKDQFDFLSVKFLSFPIGAGKRSLWNRVQGQRKRIPQFGSSH